MRCTRHPEIEAFHFCTLCDKWHCEPCLKPLETRGRSQPLLTCPDCGGHARVGMERVPTEREDLQDLVRRPLSGEGLLTAFVLSLPLGLIAVPIRHLQAFLVFVHVACLVSYYFQTVDHVGRRRPGLPFSAAPVSRGELWAALVRGFTCLFVAAGPAFIWNAFLPQDRAIAVLLAVIGVALAPSAIISVAVTERAWTALWPFSWARVISRAPAAYGRIVGVFVATTMAWAIVDLFAIYTVGRIPILGLLFVATVNAAFAILQAVLIGGFLRRNAAELGYE